tara:strand:- start:1694 stop:1852 length:159 start_codon:yes stop_codon:yes gene_type:complete
MKYKTWWLGMVCWEINGKTGHGSAIPYDTAVSWVEEMNKKYGAGTHWVKRTR